MKKILPLLFLGALTFMPKVAHAGLSDTCNPSIECNTGQDYYAKGCNDHIETLNSCPAAPLGFFSAFSCDYGCYVRSRPDFQPCAGGVLVDNQCLTSMYVVNKDNKNYIWDAVQLIEIGGGGNGDGLWKTDNNIDIYRDTGKVGIGTNVPNYSLDIAGDLNLNKGKSGAALYASSRQMLWYNPDPALNWVTWGLDADKNFFPKKVGIGVLPDSDFDLDVNGVVSINKGGLGAALYASSRQMLWYNPDPALDFAAWGNDAGSNFFGKPVGIGTVNTGSSTKLSILNNTPIAQFASLGGTETTIQNDQDGTTFGTTNNVTSNGTGTTYGDYNIAFKTETGTVYGTNTYAQHSGANNVDKTYGLYANAYNGSSNCVGPNCAEAYGVYGSSGNTLYGTGGYFEGGFTGVHAVGRSSSLQSLGLLVENKDTGSPGAIFRCTGNCTSAIFEDGDSANAGVANSGLVIIGEPGFSHIAMDTNSIMAKAAGLATAPLYINENGNGVSFGTTVPNYKITLDNVATNIGGRGIANAWATYSDDRIKKNQHPLAYGLDDLMKLQPKSYDHYSGRVKDGKVILDPNFDNTIGLIAQEVYPIIPEAVDMPDDEKNNLWGLDYDKLIPVLIHSIQELKKEKDHEMNQLRKTNDLLLKLLCKNNPQEPVCNNHELK